MNQGTLFLGLGNNRMIKQLLDPSRLLLPHSDFMEPSGRRLGRAGEGESDWTSPIQPPEASGGETEAWRELDTCQCHWAWLPFPFLFTSLLRGACTGQPDGGLWMSHPLSRPIFSSPVFLCMIFLPEFQTVEPTSLALLLGAGNLVVLGS